MAMPPPTGFDFERENQKIGDIPDKYKEQLNEIRETMEREMGTMYSFTIQKFGNYSNQVCILGDLAQRNQKVEIYDMEPQYKELEGIYPSREAAEKKLEMLNGSEYYDDIIEYTDPQSKRTKLIGKCKHCHSYNLDRPDRFPNDIRINCQNPNCKRTLSDYLGSSKWRGIIIDKIRGSIYESSGGSISVCYNKGKWRYLPSSS